MMAKPWENRRAACLELVCRHERYMHEYEDTSGNRVLGPCKSEPRGEPKLAASTEDSTELCRSLSRVHLCGCTSTRFEAAPERVGR